MYGVFAEAVTKLGTSFPLPLETALSAVHGNSPGGTALAG